MVAKALPRATRALIASNHPEPKRESAPRVLPRINHGLFHDSPEFSANVMPNISGLDWNPQRNAISVVLMGVTSANKDAALSRRSWPR
jgi:hypothetical protein